MSGRDLARRHTSPQCQARVGGDVTMRPDELVIRLRPLPLAEWGPSEREAQTVITWPIAPPLAVWPLVCYRPARWVFDRQAVTALGLFALVTTVVVALWLVVG